MKLSDIHKELKIEYGNFSEEIPEQLLISKYLKGNEKVLELGSNIGRSSLVIAYLLNKNNNNNFLTLEPNIIFFNQLKHNKEINNLNFYCENVAISKNPLIQKDLNKFNTHHLLSESTWPSDFLPNGYVWVNTMTMEEIKEKYNIDFNTLIIDCEGAFYQILLDSPEILNGINLIIMENDYLNLKSKKYVDEVLINNGFNLEYNEAGGFGPCFEMFYQVWKK